MLHTTLSLAMPLKMLAGMEDGRLRLFAADYHRIAAGVLSRLDAMSTGELISVARSAEGPLAEMAESIVFDRACCLVAGDRGSRAEAERQFESLMTRLLDLQR